MTATRAVEMVAVEALVPSPLNPRKTFDDAGLQDLASSIREKGILNALIGRRGKKKGTIEIVTGERRWRAAKILGLAEVPVDVRELDDESASEVQQIENLQREDLAPMEEAAGFKALADRGRSVEEIAARVGKRVGYVYQRLRLLELPEGVRAAIESGALPMVVGVDLLRIPSPDLRERIGKEITSQPKPISTAWARETIARRFLVLKAAPFDMTDETLVPAAGACGPCPKRTGNQRDLFGATNDDDLCTDPSCHASKVAASYRKAVAEAETSGVEVLDEKKNAKVLPREWRGRPDERSGYVLLSDTATYTAKGAVPWSKVIEAGKGKVKVPTSLGRDPQTGAAVVLVRPADVKEALKVAGVKVAGVTAPATGVLSTTRPTMTPKEKAASAKARLENQVEEATVVAVREAIEASARTFTPDAFRDLARLAIRAVWRDTVKEAARARAIEVPKKKDLVDVVDAWIQKAEGREPFALVVELILRRIGADPYDTKAKAARASFLEAMEVDPADIRKDLVAAREAKKKGGGSKAGARVAGIPKDSPAAKAIHALHSPAKRKAPAKGPLARKGARRS